jgi:cytochrome c553
MKLKHSLAAFALASAALTAFGATAIANWGEKCAKCHGDDGKGETKMGKKLSIRDLSSAKAQAEFTDEQALTSMKEGIKDKAGKVTMKPIEGLSDEEMKALVPFVRALKK